MADSLLLSLEEIFLSFSEPESTIPRVIKPSPQTGSSPVSLLIARVLYTQRDKVFSSAEKKLPHNKWLPLDSSELSGSLILMTDQMALSIQLSPVPLDPHLPQKTCNPTLPPVRDIGVMYCINMICLAISMRPACHARTNFCIHEPCNHDFGAVC